MKDRILSVAVALSLIAVALVIAPSSTEAAVYYTGEVQTTDDTGEPIDTCFRGDDVYVRVETYYRGNASNESFLVELRTQTGILRDSFEAVTGDPETGVYESWTATPWTESLWTGHGFEGELLIYDVILYADNGWTWIEIDRTQLVVRNVGLFVDPDTDYYYPGQQVSLKVVTTNTEDFYVQVVNDTFTTIQNWTNLEVGEGDDFTWETVWTIQSDIADGDYRIYVRSEDNNAFWAEAMYSAYITITKYVLMVDSMAEYVLPGQTVSIIYDVVDVATLTHYSGAVIEWNAMWIDVDDEEVWDSGTLDGSSGVFPFMVDEDIALYSDIEMMFWANESDDRSADAAVYMTVGTIAASVTLGTDMYAPGEMVDMTVAVDVGLDEYDWWDALPGAEVDIVVSKNDTEIPAYSASGMMTDVTGVVQHVFTLADDAPKGTYIVDVTVTYLDYEVERMAAFNVGWSGYMTVEFSKDYYYSGQVATIDFKVVWNNVELGATSVYYVIYGDTGLLATGNSTTGSASFPIPGDYVGSISVSATTVIEGYYFSDVDNADVRLADLSLYPVAEWYRAGDTITWVYELATVMSNASLSYRIVDGDGLKVASGELEFAKSGSFDFVVPEVDPANEYTAMMMVDDGLGHILTESASAWLFAEYELQIWLDSGAGYTSRAFEPGATMVFAYSITAIGAEHLPVYRISFYANDEYIDGNVLVTETTGTFEYTVHENVADGDYMMYAWLYDPSSGGGSLSFDSVGFAVKTDQSLWDKSVGGLSLFETIVLLLLLIMVILLVLVPMIKARTGAKPYEPTSKPMELEPPAPESLAEEPKS